MTEESNIEFIEQTLAGTLRPISPRREFVRGLGSRIKGLRQTIRKAGAGTWQFIILALAGLSLLGLILAMAGRILVKHLGLHPPENG